MLHAIEHGETEGLARILDIVRQTGALDATSTATLGDPRRPARPKRCHVAAIDPG